MYENLTPAPYERPISHFAKGGRAKNKPILVHMNNKEMDILDHIQGHSNISKNGVRNYTGGLEDIFKNPHLVKRVHEHSHKRREHHAEGDSIGNIDHLKSEGRFGDNGLAWIGPKTHEVFDSMAGNATRNPATGHPEYWSLGGALGGLWDTIKGVGEQVLPQALPMAQQALGNNFGQAGQMASSFLPSVANSVMGTPSQPNQMASTIGNGINSYLGGSTPQQALGQTMQSAGQNLGGAMGSALSGTGQSLGQGQRIGDSLQSGARNGMNQMGGMNQFGNMFKSALGSFGKPPAQQQNPSQQQNNPRPYNPYDEQYQLPHQQQRPF